jgi:DNA-directed RNA polymerase specialized sigma24 family protein
MVPGTRTFLVFFADLANLESPGRANSHELVDESQARLRRIALEALASCRGRALMSPEDLVQDLHERVASMDAARRYDPAKGTPAAFLYGVAATLVRERLFRRQPPVMASTEETGEPSFDGNQLAQLERHEALEELQICLSQLSAGEVRALVAEFGPLPGHSCPVTHRRRLQNSDALPRAIEGLRKLGAHGWGQ